jgi:hypothetical protein
LGWWKTNRDGGIDFSCGRAFPNALGGCDASEDYYNGDGPADSLHAALDQMQKLLGVEVDEEELVDGVATDELLDLFLKHNLPTHLAEHRVALLKIVDDTWDEIERQYWQEWGRPPYQEERRRICAFVLT